MSPDFGESLKEMDWKILLRQIKKGTCVPFIGPGLSTATYPSKAQIAQKWAEEEGYPLEDRSDLARVAQFLAVQNAAAYPVDKLIEEYANIKPPDFTNRQEPHRILADLPLKYYITTNYDDHMLKSLASSTIRRDARRDSCHWRHSTDTSSVFADEYEPTQSDPVVFHLFGYTEELNSLVLTEHDYLKFLATISANQKLIPTLIQGAIAEGALLFIGYQFNDWDFRILIHTLATYIGKAERYAHVSVITPDMKQEAAIYLNLYFKQLILRVYWGTCQDFLAELKTRWEAFNNG